MKYIKNKKKRLTYYMSILVILGTIFAIIPFLMFKKSDAVQIVVIGEVSLVAIAIALKRMVQAELNQYVILYNDHIQCNSFIVKGSVMNAEIKYDLIQSVMYKSSIFLPFSKCIYLCIPNNPPAVISNDFVNHQELWMKICENCRRANPNVKIDSKIFDYITNHQSGDGSVIDHDKH